MEKQVLEHMDPKVLGGRLQEARRARGLTQQAVAEYLGVARTTLVAIEKGERRLLPDELIKLAAFYGPSVSGFVRRQLLLEGFAPQSPAALRHLSVKATDLKETAAQLERPAHDY